MKLAHMLIFRFAKLALFLSSGAALLTMFLQLPVLITGGVMGLSSGSIDGNGNETTGQIVYHRIISIYDFMIFMLPSALIYLGIAYVCWELARMLTSIGNNLVFDTKNFRRLYRSGACIVIVDLVLLVCDALNTSYARKIFHQPLSVTIEHHEQLFSFQWLLWGCLLVIIALAFRKGVELEEEQDLTV